MNSLVQSYYPLINEPRREPHIANLELYQLPLQRRTCLTSVSQVEPY